jgi:hypothetical protein
MSVPTLRKTIVWSLMAIAVAMFVFSLYIFHAYHYGNLPRLPQPETGRIIPSNNHGSVVYLTREEDSLLQILQFGGTVPFFIGFILNRRWRVVVHPLEGLPAEQRYKILHGPSTDYKKVRETYRTKD